VLLASLSANNSVKRTADVVLGFSDKQPRGRGLIQVLGPMNHQLRRFFLTCVAVLFAMDAQSSAAQIPIVALPSGYCIELRDKGFGGDLKKLVAIAMSDSSPGLRFGRSSQLNQLNFYKAIPASDGNRLHLVFFIEGWSDIYMVYTTNSSRSNLESKTTYGSLFYPCSTPTRAHGA